MGLNALFRVCCWGYADCGQLLIDYNADVNAKCKNGDDVSVLDGAARIGQLSCVEMLVQNGADLNCQDIEGWTPLFTSALNCRLTIAQYLLEQKADVHYRVSKECNSKNQDALYFAMNKYATDRTPGTTFAFLSCNTDAKSVKINDEITTTMRDSHTETYTRVQAYIDEYFRILQPVLSEHVPVDPRFGLGQMGIYQEPLERVLEYLGMSMNKDQVVNTSIDGEAVKRALIPGHLLNANHWFNKYTKETQVAQLQEELRAKLAQLTGEYQTKIADVYA
jgi:hypothetical protein